MPSASCFTCSQPIKEAGDAVLTWDEYEHPGRFALAHRGQCFATMDAWLNVACTVELDRKPDLFRALAGLS